MPISPGENSLPKRPDFGMLEIEAIPRIKFKGAGANLLEPQASITLGFEETVE
jgi:hypothetical protein